MLKITTKVWAWPTLRTPTKLRKVIRANKTVAVTFMKSGPPEKNALRYAPNPMSAKALLRRRLNHKPNPAMVPVAGPKARSKYTYEPPDVGIAVASSAFESAAGITKIPAMRYARKTESPVFENARPGSTKIPEPSIVEILIAIIVPSPRRRSNCCEPKC